MHEALEAERTPRLLSREALPLFALFFLWSFGTGALWVGQPLLAYELAGSAFAVGASYLVIGIPQFTTPLIGILVDRLGRRRVIVAGAALHGGAAAMQAFTDSYPVFLGLAFISGLGTAAWLIGSTTLLADFTRIANRGRGVALRSMTGRFGALIGPLAGGSVAAIFDVRALFVFVAVTKVLIVVITLLLVRETRPVPASAPEAETLPRQRLRPGVSLFLTRGFLILIVVALALAPTELLRAGLSARAEDTGLSAATVGTVMSAFSLIAMLIAMPVGTAVDWWGRKAVLLTGLAMLAAVMFLAPWADRLLILMVVLGVLTIGNLTTGIALETQAMDLAPREKRGYFLGTWLAMKELSGIAWFALLGMLGIGIYATGATVSDAWLPPSGLVFGVVLLGAAAFLAVSRMPRS